MNKQDTPARFLAWDSDFFGMRIARVNATILSEAFLSRLETRSQQENIACLYLLLNADETPSVQLAEEHDFHLRDVRMTFQLKRPKLVPDLTAGNIRLSRASDLVPLQKIARTAYAHTRFYNDPCFPQDKCDEMYEIWITKSLTSDFASAVLVAEIDGLAAGYMTVDYDGRAREGQIGLVGVAPEMQGQGIGRQLMQHTLDWFWQQGAEEVKVATQGRNIGAQRLYQAYGFRTALVELWYHRWFKAC